MRQHCKVAEPGILSQDTVSVSTYETSYTRALNLGICITDIGYSAFYNDRQTALNYLARAEQLMRELHLENLVSSLSKRISSNIDKPDSLSKILLTLYNDAQKQLNENGNEKIAFYISSGSFLEGLAITFSSKCLPDTPIYGPLLVQQKKWLDQLTEAVTYLAPDKESQDLYNTFFTLQHFFKPAKVEKHQLVFIPSDSFLKLRTKIVQLRDDVVKG